MVDAKHNSYRLFMLMNRAADLRRRVFPQGTRREAFYRRYLRPPAAVLLTFLAQGRRRQKPRGSYLHPAIKVERGQALAPAGRILAIKTDHIGDFIFAFPAFQALRESFPDAHITLLCGEWNRAMAEALRLFDEVICVNVYQQHSSQRGSFIPDPALGYLKKLPAFDLAIDVKVEPDSRFLLDYIPAKFKAGFASPLMPPDMDLVVPAFPLVAQGERAREAHTRTLLLILIEAVAATFRSAQAVLQNLANLSAAAPGFQAPHHTGPLIGFNPGSGASAKNWPLDYAIQLLRQCLSDFNATILLFGSAAQKEDAAQIGARLKSERVIDYTGQLSLSAFIGAMKTLDLFIGYDTGSTHIAAGLNVPTLCIFSGSAPKGRFEPAGEKLVLLRADIPCASCGLKNVEDCPREHRCMTAITPDLVLAELHPLLHGAAAVPKARVG